MYARQTAEGRRQRGLAIPANYSGNAFPPEQDDAPKADTYEEEATEEAEESSGEEISAVALPSETDRATGAGLFHFFGGSGGIGFEELLIIGLVLIISQNEVKDDLAFLLLLLLFIK